MAIPDAFLDAPVTPLAAAPGGVAKPVILSMNVPKQQRDEWCWAAVGVGIRNAYRELPPLSQCQLAADVFDDLNSCCDGDDDSDGHCDGSQLLSPVLGAHHDRLAFAPEGSDLKFFTDEIDAGHPVPVRMKKTGQTGHFVVVAGYQRIPQDAHLFVWDPVTGTRIPVSASGFLRSFRGWAWDYSYRTKGNPVPKEP